MTPENIIRRHNKLKQNRKRFITAWEDARKYASPHSPPILGGIEDVGERDRDNTDSTAELAGRNLASVVGSSTTPPDQKWINLRLKFETKDPAMLEYVDTVEQIIIESINSSNFYIKKHEFDKGRVYFGTSVMFCEEGRGDKDLNFRTIPIGDVALAEDHEGNVDTVFREFKMTARDLVQKFGPGKLSDASQKKYEKNPFEEIQMVHAVYPRTDVEREKNTKGKFKTNSANMPFADKWIEKSTKHLVHNGGFRTFPYIVSRWEKEAGEVYGHGPILQSMADIRSLNVMERDRLELAQKVTNPPYGIYGAEPGEVDLTPGAMNEFDQDTVVKELVTGANYPITDATVRNKKDDIQDALYVKQFQSLDRRADKEMTAAEVQALQMETLRILAPVLARNQLEIMRPLFIRILDILGSNGKIPPFIDAEGNVVLLPMDLDYINELSRAMRLSEVNAIRAVIMGASQMAQVDPSVLDNIDFDKAYEVLKDAYAIPANISRSEEAIKKIREARAEQQQQMQQIQMAQVQTGLAESAAKAKEKTARADAKNRGD